MLPHVDACDCTPASPHTRPHFLTRTRWTARDRAVLYGTQVLRAGCQNCCGTGPVVAVHVFASATTSYSRTVHQRVTGPAECAEVAQAVRGGLGFHAGPRGDADSSRYRPPSSTQ